MEPQIIRNGLVVDGTGSEPQVADVAISEGKILEVGHGLSMPAGAASIDATGLVVAPGFIDIHTHYDAQVAWDPGLGASTQYGVTTMVMGNCGFGVAPVNDNVGFLVQLLANVEGMSARVLEEGLSWDWQTFGDYLDAIDRPMAATLVPLVGHSALRHGVMGEGSYERIATDDELIQIQSALRSALEAGSWGFSSSMAPTHVDTAGRPAPSRLADRREFEALADVLGEYPFGIVGMSPESKNRGLNESDTSLLTMLSVRGGASVNWNPLVHVTGLPDLWKTNLHASEIAAEAGARVFGVFNPASFGGTRVDLNTCFMFAPLPHWKPISILPTGEKVKAFSDPAVRQTLEDDIENDKSLGFLTVRLRAMWDVLRITEAFSPEVKQYVGRIVGDIARESNRSPLAAMLDIAAADDLRTVFMQEDVHDVDEASTAAFQTMARSPYVVYGGTDAGAHIDMIANESMPARVMEWRVKEQQSLSLEEAVHGFTAMNADALGLAGRGRLLSGNVADVVIFDLDRIGAGPAYVVNDMPGGGERMMTEAKGIAYTMVNGQLVYVDGKQTGALPGGLLRSGAR